jgi:hypothetical protein
MANAEPISTLAGVMKYLNSDEGMPAGLACVPVKLADVKDLSAEDRLDLRSCLDAIR